MFASLPKVLGITLIVVGIALAPSVAISFAADDGYLDAYLIMAVSGLSLGSLFMVATPAPRSMRTREGFLAVALAWISVTALGAVPFVWVGNLDVATAVFESASGFTTTGSTAIADLDAHPTSLLFFRQATQWFGGIGVVVAAIALLPILGMGGMQLMKAETTGPAKSDKMRPRIRHTAQALWRIYLLLTGCCIVAYWFAGMPLFDAVAHSLTTVSTGGYSTHDGSLGYYRSPAIEVVAVVFMLLGAISFAAHFRAWTDRAWSWYLSNSEVRAFGVSIACLVIFVAVVLWGQSAAEPLHALRLALFEVVSIITSTGYGITDFSIWPTLLPVLLIFLSFVGGCAGSTAGGMKVIRFLVLTRQAGIEVLRLIHPRLERPLMISGSVVDDRIVRAVWAFFSVYAFVFVALMLVLIALGLDQVSAFAAVATCLNNLGPGLGEVAQNFASVGDGVKWVSAFACILGRLEILTVFVLLTPEYWRP